MSTIEQVQLRQVRDFGQILSSTFVFLRHNWKPLFRAIAIGCLPFAIIGGFLAGGSVGAMQQMQFSGEGDPSAFFSTMATSLVGMIPGFLLLIFGYVLLTALVHEYLRAYHLGEHFILSPGELVKRGFSQFGSYFSAGLLMGLLSMVGFILCVLPGVYAWTVLSLTFMSHAIERTGASGSLGRSNQLVQGDFWPTLGLVIVISLLTGVINYVVQLPFMIVGLVIGINTGLEAAHGNEVGFPAWFGIFNSISTAVQWCAQMLTYPMVAVCMGLKYFSRVEEKEGLGLREKIAGFDKV